MKNRTQMLSAIVLTAFIAVLGCTENKPAETVEAPMSEAETIKKGEYLVDISFAANITSDDSGIGTWSLEQFTRALTQGKAKGLEEGRPLLPPMPWFNYVAMRPEDIEAVFKFLKSTNPVHNVVPAPIPFEDMPH